MTAEPTNTRRRNWGCLDVIMGVGCSILAGILIAAVLSLPETSIVIELQKPDAAETPVDGADDSRVRRTISHWQWKITPLCLLGCLCVAIYIHERNRRRRRSPAVIERLRGDLREADENLARIEGAKSQANDNAERLEDQLNDAKEELARISQKNALAEQGTNQTQEEIRQATEKVRNLEAEKSQVLQQHVSLEQEMEVARNQLDSIVTVQEQCYLIIGGVLRLLGHVLVHAHVSKTRTEQRKVYEWLNRERAKTLERQAEEVWIIASDLEADLKFRLHDTIRPAIANGTKYRYLVSDSQIENFQELRVSTEDVIPVAAEEPLVGKSVSGLQLDGFQVVFLNPRRGNPSDIYFHFPGLSQNGKPSKSTRSGKSAEPLDTLQVQEIVVAGELRKEIYTKVVELWLDLDNFQKPL